MIIKSCGCAINTNDIVYIKDYKINYGSYGIDFYFRNGEHLMCGDFSDMVSVNEEIKRIVDILDNAK